MNHGGVQPHGTKFPSHLRKMKIILLGKDLKRRRAVKWKAALFFERGQRRDKNRYQIDKGAEEAGRKAEGYDPLNTSIVPENNIETH